MNINLKHFAVLIFFVASPAFATMGGDASSVETDRANMKGSAITVTSHGNFEVHAFTAGGITFKEYISTTGKVFALTWNGSVQPDLHQVLGSYHTEYAAKFASRPRSKIRRPIKIVTSDIIVKRGGHMRAWHGVAHLGSLPSGVTEGDLR